MTLSRGQRTAIVLAVAAAVLLALGYGVSTLLASRQPAGRVTVVVSFYPLQAFAQRLVGADVSVRVLVPPGVEPHDWEPTPGDVVDVAEADLLVYVHPQFETYVPDLLGAVSDPPLVVETSAGLPLLTFRIGGQTVVDPHIWLDPLLAQHQVRLIRDALIQVDPVEGDAYTQRADALLAELEGLHRAMEEGLASCELRTFIASHAAFRYFALRYNLSLEPIALNPEVEPAPNRLTELIAVAVAQGVTVVYTEPLVPSDAAQVIAEEIGGTTLPLNPVESLSAEEVEMGRTYFSLMQDNLANLRVGLRCAG